MTALINLRILFVFPCACLKVLLLNIICERSAHIHTHTHKRSFLDHHRIIIIQKKKKKMPVSTQADVDKATSAYDFVVLDADGKEYDLAQRRGLPTLFFNSASGCGLAKTSFENANKLCKKYASDYGFTCLAFPSASFGQEPLESAEAKKDGCSTHEAQFPILGKVLVNGDDASPLWKYLQKERSGFMFTQFIKWNYTSFLCNCDGRVVDRFSPGISFDAVEESLKRKVLVHMGRQSSQILLPPSKSNSSNDFQVQQQQQSEQQQQQQHSEAKVVTSDQEESISSTSIKQQDDHQAPTPTKTTTNQTEEKADGEKINEENYSKGKEEKEES